MANALAITHYKFPAHCFQGSISSLLIADPKLSGRHSVFERCLWSAVSSNSTNAGMPAPQVNRKWRAPGRNLNLRRQGPMGMGVKAEAVEVVGYGGTGEGGSGGGGPHGNGNGGEGRYDGKMNNNGNGGFLSWYLMLLEKYPVTTKAVTSALLTFFGDLFCQLVIDKSPKLDVKRLSMFTLLGLVLVGPTLHFWTKEQLGYAVSCGRRMTYRVLGFCFSVLSSKHSPPYLQERIDAFIDKLQQILDEMDDKEFESYKVALIARKLEKDPSVTDEADRYWTQVVEKRYLFEVLKLEADELTSIQKSDVIDWYNSFLNANSSRCRRLNIHVWGCNANKAEAAESTKLGNVIDDVSALKLTSEFYPSLC